jgi:hypothetical protein
MTLLNESSTPRFRLFPALLLSVLSFGSLSCSGEGDAPLAPSEPDGGGNTRVGGAGDSGSGGGGDQPGGGGSSGGGGMENHAGSGGASGGSEAGGAPGDGPGPALTPEEYCEKRISLEQPWCDYISDCCSAADRDDLYFITPVCAYGQTTPAECVGTFDTLASLGVGWDGTWADACIVELAKNYPSTPPFCSGLDAETWSDFARTLPGYSQIEACQRLTRGSKTFGESCAWDAECEHGLTCFTLTGQASGDYVCLSPGIRGSQCLRDGDCETGLHCIGDAMPRCEQLGYRGASCQYSNDCQEGFVCAGGQCATTKRPNEACTVDDRCQRGYGCGFVSEKCEALGYEGQACQYTPQCRGRCDSVKNECVTICGGTRH